MNNHESNTTGSISGDLAQNGIIAGYNEVILRTERDLTQFFATRS